MDRECPARPRGEISGHRLTGTLPRTSDRETRQVSVRAISKYGSKFSGLEGSAQPEALGKQKLLAARLQLPGATSSSPPPIFHLRSQPATHNTETRTPRRQFRLFFISRRQHHSMHIHATCQQSRFFFVSLMPAPGYQNQPRDFQFELRADAERRRGSRLLV